MPNKQVSDALEVLNAPTTLSILSLSEPILGSNSNQNLRPSHHSSADSNTDGLTPALLEADLVHYKDLFSKLRFSYVEQVTKERFLKAIVADPPELVSATQNAALQEELATAKASLKAKKMAMEDMVKELEHLARRLAQTYEIIQLQTTQLESLPDDIAHLEAHIATLKAAQEPASADPEMNLSLTATSNLLSEREAELAELDRQLEHLQSELPARKRHVSDLGAELGPLEARKRTAIDEARDAQRKRGTGGMAAELEERGRWLKGVETGLKVMLEV